MTLHVNDGGSWKAAAPFVNDGGTWKPVQEVWVNDAGTWKLAFQNIAFSPTPGGYAATESGTASFTITCNKPAVWAMSKTNWMTTQSVPNGGTSTSFTITLSQSGSFPNFYTEQDNVSISATVDGKQFDFAVALTAVGSGGGPID